MLTLRYPIFSFLAVSTLLVTITGCHKESSKSTGPLEPLSVTYIAPDSAKVGDVIRINGSGFNTVIGGNQVDFNGTPGVIQTATFSTLQVKVPAGATNGKITVTVNNRSVTSPTAFKIIPQTGNGNVDYITVLSGSAAFNKFATLTQVPTFMYIDKVNNILYYTNANTFNDGSSVYSLALSTGKETKLSTDARVTNVKLITTDAAGKVYLVASASAESLYNVFRVDADGTNLVQLLNQVDLANDVKSKIFYVSSTGNLFFANHSYTFNSNNVATEVKSYQPLANALTAGLGKANSFNYSLKDQLYTYNMSSSASSSLNLSFSQFFGKDDANLQAQNVNGNGKYNVVYTTDNNNTLYGIYQHSYESGQLVNTYYLRKYDGSNTLLAKFTNSYSVSPLYVEPQTSVGGILMASDANGNLYLRDNDKDIIKVTHK